MTRVQKQRMFEKLVAEMSSDDVEDLVGALLESGHEETIFSVLPVESVDGDTVDTSHSIDPFFNE